MARSHEARVAPIVALVVLGAGALARSQVPVDPAAALTNVARDAAPDFRACAFASRLDEATLRAIAAEVAIEGGRVAVRIPGERPGMRALERCLTSAGRRHPIAGLARDATAPAITTRPFAELDLPMDPAPARPTTTLDLPQAERLHANLAATDDEAERLRILADIETHRVGIPVSDALSVIASFPSRRVEALAMLCRITVGRNLGARFARLVDDPVARRAFVASLRGRCGVETPPSPPRLPSPPMNDVSMDTCNTDADCTLACPAPPDCCGGCGCFNAVNVRLAQAVHAACARRADDSRSCPALGCAYIETYATCREGRCEAVRMIGPGMGL